MKLVNAICKNGNIVLLDLDELKDSEYLKDAHIFNRLFGFSNIGFQQEELKKDKDENIVIFKNYNIMEIDVLDFLYFIRNGKIRFDISANNMIAKKKEDYYNIFIQNIDSISSSGIFLKFGPFPQFDNYVENSIKNLNNMKGININNPMTPEEDVNNLFHWTIKYEHPQIPPPNGGFWSSTIIKGGRIYWRCRILPRQS